MNRTVTTAIAFIFGAAIGSVATWKFVEKKYARIAQEEIDSVKEVFSKRDRKEVQTEKPEPVVEAKIEEPKEKIAVNKTVKSIIDYSGYSTPQTDSKPEDPKPYVIPPESFGELEDEGYTCVSLTFCSDQIVLDDNNDILEDVEGVIGFDSLSHFGEYEEDAVYVRNDKYRCDYEILLDQRTHEQVIGDQGNKRLGVL